MRALVFLAVASACLGMPSPHSFNPFSRPIRRVAGTTMGNLIHEFGLDVCSELQQPGNVVISPLSISAVLSVLLLGSAGPTHLQLRRGLHFPEGLPEENIHVNFQRLLDGISNNNPNDVTLNIANGLFLQTGAGIVYNFTQSARTYYNSIASTLDIKSSSVAATKTINKWVKESTSGMIPNLFEFPLDPHTTFVAVNTVFFNGKWESPFTASYTRDRDFDTGKEKIKVPMMSGTLIVKYVNIPSLDAHMAAIPYKGGRQAMYIILPKGSVSPDLELLEQELYIERVNALINNMTELNVKVMLPRMRLAFKTSLREILTNLGMSSIFKPNMADFSRLSSKHVWVDDILHETVIEVTEEGTKAAAATASDFNRMGTSRVFLVNRPAIFFIRDEQSGVPLFWGRLVEPEPLRSYS